MVLGVLESTLNHMPNLRSTNLRMLVVGEIVIASIERSWSYVGGVTHIQIVLHSWQCFGLMKLIMFLVGKYKGHWFGFQFKT